MAKDSAQKIKDKISSLLKERGWNWSILAERAGFSPAAISLKRKGLRHTTPDDIRRIAHAFGVPTSTILGQEEIKFKPIFSRIPVPVPVIYKIPTRYPVSINTRIIVDWIYLPEDMATNKSIFGLRVPDKSMSPLLEEGDYIIVTPQSKAKNKDIILLRLNDKGLIRKHLKRKQHILLQPINPAYEPIIVIPDDDFEIIGVIYGIGLRRLKR